MSESLYKLYKWLNDDGTPINGGTGRWPLPNDNPGEWLTVDGDLEPRVNGLHLCRVSDLISWIGPALYVAEYTGELIECDDKVVVRTARLTRRLTQWNDKTARLFACRCVRETPLHDGRTVWDLLADDCSRNAVVVAEQFALGGATPSELAAASAAARTASAAASAAASGAAWAADSGAAMAAMAASAAASAAARAAWFAAWHSASGAARGGTSAAAEAAARAARAARAAWAGDSVAATVGVWAGDRAAWDATRQWQASVLCEVIGLAPDETIDTRHTR